MAKKETNYKLVVNDHSACVSDLTLGISVGCTTTSLDCAEAWKAQILAAHPGAKVEIQVGRCSSAFYEYD